MKLHQIVSLSACLLAAYGAFALPEGAYVRTTAGVEWVVDSQGNILYGIDPNGYKVDMYGTRITPTKTDECGQSVLVMNKGKQPTVESICVNRMIWGPYKSAAEAAAAAARSLNDGTCKLGQEAALKGYKFNGHHYYGDIARYMNQVLAQSKAPALLTTSSLNDLFVTTWTMHDHLDPVPNGDSKWFSLDDWEAILPGVPTYMTACEGIGNGAASLYRLNPDDGTVDEIDITDGHVLRKDIPPPEGLTDFRKLAKAARATKAQAAADKMLAGFATARRPGTPRTSGRQTTTRTRTNTRTTTTRERVNRPKTIAKTNSTPTTSPSATAAQSAGKRWIGSNGYIISFDGIRSGAPYTGAPFEPIRLKTPYFVFTSVYINCTDKGKVCGYLFSAEVPNQLTHESMAIGDAICRDLQTQLGITIESDGRRCHRTYSWSESGFRTIELNVNNENDETPGKASFSLIVRTGPSC